MKRTTAVIASAAIVSAGILSFDTVTYASTGDSLILGKLNSTPKLTTLSRTRPGAALQLRTTPTSPPLRVTSGARVPRLNADKVDGLDAAALQTRVTTYVMPSVHSQPTVDAPLPPLVPGTYRIDFRIILGSNAPQVWCVVDDTTADGHYAQPIRVAGAPLAGTAFLTGSDYLTVAAGDRNDVFCTANDGSGLDMSAFGDFQSRVTLTRVDSQEIVTLTE